MPNQESPMDMDDFANISEKTLCPSSDQRDGRSDQMVSPVREREW